MNRILYSLISLSFFIVVFVVSVCADNNNEHGSVSCYRNMSCGNFFMYHKWFCADGVIYPIAGSVASAGSGDNYIEVYNNYFQEFDYEPSEEFHLLSPIHSQDTFSIYKEENAVFQVKLNDPYNNPPSIGYPQLFLMFPDGSTQTYTMNKNDPSDDSDIYTCALSLNTGSYGYKYITTNKYYAKGFYEISGQWHVTSRPYNFVRKDPHPLVEVIPDNVCFSWSVKSDEIDDFLSYELYTGFNPVKKDLLKVEGGPAVNSSSFIISKLDCKKRYYWYMIIKNKFGASLETEMFYFATGGLVDKFYNAPNPFNPAKGIKTDFVFPMRYDGTVQIIIYSEYGDRVWESDRLFFFGNSSQIIKYDGKDNSGKMLYNGSYLAILKKEYQDKTEIEKCRILIIK